MNTRHRRRWAAALALALAGCGVLALARTGRAPGATPWQLTGKVRYRGEVLPSGTVTFLGADGKRRHGLIAENGTYKVTGVAPGAAGVGVVSHPRTPAGMGGEKAKVHLPPHYARPETSGLTCQVEGGPQTFDIDLPPAERPAAARATH
jgi:hypothetical protein